MPYAPSQSRRAFLQTSAMVAIGSALAACTNGAGGMALASPGTDVSYQFYRNATAKLHYAGLTLLLDPMLSARGELPSFAGIAPNPTVDLPVSPREIISGIDAVVVSHLHEDHFDQAAAAILDKSLTLLTPRNDAPISPRDPAERVRHSQRLRDYGFTDVREIDADGSGSTMFRGVKLTQVWGRHGQGQVGQLMGGVNGIVFEAPDQPTIFWAGDTVFDAAEIEPILALYKPDIVIAHTGGPIVEVLSPEVLLMDADQATAFIAMAERHNPSVQVIAVHMEALDHCFSTRGDLRRKLSENALASGSRINIPDDGERIDLG